MTATNHVITGAVVGAVITTPIIAIPLAFAAHFAMDGLPHWGHSKLGGSGKKAFVMYLAVDMGLAAAILLSIFLLRIPGWPILVACGVSCASSDLMWLPKFVRAQIGKPVKPPTNPILRFHSMIQWGEKPWGWSIEAIWFVTMLLVFIRLA